MYRLLHHQDGPLGFALGPDSIAGHRFTVALGPNGTGKSQLLRSIAEAHRASSAKAHSHTPESHKEAQFGDAPPTLLVLSNMVTDVFVNTSKRRDSYRYLGLRQASNNTSTGALRDATSAAILECFRSSDSENLLRPVLDTLGADRCFASFETARSRAKISDGAPRLVAKFLESLELDVERTHYASSDALLTELRIFHDSVHRERRLFDFDAPELDLFWSICLRFELEAMDVIRLLRRLGLASLQVHVRLGERVTDLDNLSTGQLLLLSTFARVAAHAGPRSLVIIDEPEAGLHPNWQSTWIPLMRATIPAEYGCHFFIATHSPYLISDADDVLVPGMPWGTFDQFDEPYQGRSVENILYRVFGARIAGNLMVENDLRILVQVISQGTNNLTRDQRLQSEDALQRLQTMQDADTENLNIIVHQAKQVLAQ